MSKYDPFEVVAEESEVFIFQDRDPDDDPAKHCILLGSEQIDALIAALQEAKKQVDTYREA